MVGTRKCYILSLVGCQPDQYRDADIGRVIEDLDRGWEMLKVGQADVAYNLMKSAVRRALVYGLGTGNTESRLVYTSVRVVFAVAAWNLDHYETILDQFVDNSSIMDLERHGYYLFAQALRGMALLWKSDNTGSSIDRDEAIVAFRRIEWEHAVDKVEPNDELGRDIMERIKARYEGIDRMAAEHGA